MRALQHLLHALLGLLTLLLLVHAQDQSGFISIDCGLPENSSYTEPNTGINYISDVNFINTGESKSVQPAEQSTHQKQLTHLRSFPSGTRNCYRINVTSGTKYLVRASFLYGNYDDQNQLPVFDLHLGANFWDTVKFNNASISTNSEIIHVPSLNYIHVCLVNTGSGTPFVSAIELRTLKNTAYETASGSLARFLRFDLGSTTNLTYRYKDDVYDRFWVPLPYELWTDVSMSATPNQVQNDYKPPPIVMSTAATPKNESASLDLYWDTDVNTQYYVFMHFSEVVVLAENETRAFNVSLNGKYWYGPLIPIYQTTNTIYSPTALSGSTRYLFSLFKTGNSTLPPILNALEVYTVKDFSQAETDQNDVDAITSIKSAYGVARNWDGDPCAPVAYMWEGLNCSLSSNDPPRITSLTLSSSGLTGGIPSYLSKLPMLQYLDLSNNSLSGSIPDFLTQLQSLKVLNLESNNLTGIIPSELVDRSKKGSLSLSVEQNPNLCETASCTKTTDEKKKKSNVLIPVVASMAGVIILTLLIAALLFALRKRKPPVPVNVDAEPNNLHITSLESKKRQYSYADLLKITNNFDRNGLLGKGGFGEVFHGFIDDTPVAVKILSATSGQGYQQFVAEVKSMMRIHHRNLTSLVGYCNEENKIGLIYEYMANGNLDEHLSGKSGNAKFLTWEDRIRIAMEAAQGLEYLHHGLQLPIIHRDVKTTNILLTENLQAKLADFGLSKSFPTDGGTHVSTIVAGTPGYLDPEYYISNRLTEKSDVYSFGVVILEIVTGQPVISRNNEQEKTHISQWVSSELSKGDIKNIIDSRLQGEFDTSSAWKAVEIAMACVSPISSRRPTMSDVVTELKECLATELARARPGRGAEDKDSIEMLSINLTTELNPLAR